MTPHKHRDLIVAWANGAKVQIKSQDDEWNDLSNPNWRDDNEYRVKPPPVVRNYLWAYRLIGGTKWGGG